jgi:hypothetical protein
MIRFGIPKFGRFLCVSPFVFPAAVFLPPIGAKLEEARHKRMGPLK